MQCQVRFLIGRHDQGREPWPGICRTESQPNNPFDQGRRHQNYLWGQTALPISDESLLVDLGHLIPSRTARPHQSVHDLYSQRRAQRNGLTYPRSHKSEVKEWLTQTHWSKRRGNIAGRLLWNYSVEIRRKTSRQTDWGWRTSTNRTELESRGTAVFLGWPHSDDDWLGGVLWDRNYSHYLQERVASSLLASLFLVQSPLQTGASCQTVQRVHKTRSNSQFVRQWPVI